MQIHHEKMRQALQMGCYISNVDGRFRIFWPQQSVELFGNTADEALNTMRLLQYNIENGNVEATKAPADPTHINGVAMNGAIAYKEGTPASDCPYPETSPSFARWNNQWDEAADLATNPPPKGPGSVITNRYRALYSEMGHPTHCGDELANLLNSICHNKGGTNLDLFEAVCNANGIDLSKYNRDKKGWQGRLRMTGRNLLSKKVYQNKGLLLTPDGMSGPYQLSSDWMYDTERKFKPRS